jgi:predicted histone-like DNA-binding protein
MALKFKAVARPNPQDRTAPSKFYAQVINNGQVQQRELATDIAEISTVSTIDTLANIEGFIKIVPKKLADGKSVKLGDFGTFRVTVNSEGVDTAEELTSSHIKKYTVHFRPGKLFKQVLNNADFVKG